MSHRRGKPARKSGVCRGCGCTDDHACPGGCCWIEPDLCSACADRTRAESDAALEVEWEEAVAHFTSMDSERVQRLVNLLSKNDRAHRTRVRELSDADLQVLIAYARMGMIEAASRAALADVEAALPRE